ncbi:thioredoxin domain-containing protein [Martelella sp. HB161492]|uniref:DsbA family protein n=1 Tax=Martelella sp. HB161492 TaxID=2720726 RepID=UPI0015920BB8|nr:thioredoxin domain-containing protein [Martelella sp. HB161492]
MTTTPWKAEPLTFGHGPRVLEIFLEPTCPFCVKTFSKLDALLEAAGEGRLTVKLRLQSQPWHMFSGVITRCIIAASTLPDGREMAKKVFAAVGDHRMEFEFEGHARGPNMDATPNDIIARIESYSGVPLKAAFDQQGLETEIKWHAKYARQNGIHVSPTFMIDGLIAPKMSSGDTIEQWIAEIGLD